MTNESTRAHLPLLLFLIVFVVNVEVVYGNDSAQQGSMPKLEDDMEQATISITDLTIKDMVAMLMDKNITIRSKRLEKDLAAKNIQRAEGEFEPQLSFSLGMAHTEDQNDIEEEMIQNDTKIYKKDSTDLFLSVSKAFVTGTKLEAKVTGSKFITSTMRSLNSTESDNYKTFYSLELTQPLLRDAGTKFNRTRLRVASLSVESSKLDALATESIVVTKAIINYYDLRLAQHKVILSREKIAKTQKLLGVVKKLQANGRLSRSDVWDVENSLSRFKAALTEDLQAQREKSNQLQILFAWDWDTSVELLRAVDELPVMIASLPEFVDCFKTALENRADVKSKNIMVKQENEQVGFAKNQALPRVDLVGSYGYTGLDYDLWEAFESGMGKYPSWNIGISVGVALDGNKMKNADVTTAKIREQQARLELRALKVAVAGDVDTILNALMNADRRWQHWRKVVEREKSRIDMGIDQLHAGRLSVRDVLFLEDRYIDARFMVIEQRAAYAKTQALLAAAQGTVMEQFQ